MNRLKLYKIQLDYIKYLHQFDNKVQYNIDEDKKYNNRRPYLGIVLNVNKLNYFVPLEHPRTNHHNIKDNIFIYKIHKGKYGMLGINNMIPVPQKQLIDFDINKENEQYREILINQYRFCNKHMKDILLKVKLTYQKRVQEKNKFFINVCCNFKLLEQKCLEYKK